MARLIILAIWNNFIKIYSFLFAASSVTGLCFCWKFLAEKTNFRGSSPYGWPPVYFVKIQLLCLCWMNNSFACLVNSEPVKQEVGHMVSVLWPWWQFFQQVAQISGDYLGCFGKCQSLWLRFGQHLEKFGATFIPSSGHIEGPRLFGHTQTKFYETYRAAWSQVCAKSFLSEQKWICYQDALSLEAWMSKN